MFVHGHIPHGEAWGYLRDHLKPTTPYAAECLELARTYEPSTPAHAKRIYLAQRRPLVTPARPRKPVDQSARLDHNLLTSAHAEIKRLLVRADYAHIGRPKPKLSLEKAPPPPPLPKSPAPRDVDYMGEYARLDRKTMIESFKSGLFDRLTPARVQRAFGTPDYFNGKTREDFQ